MNAFATFAMSLVSCLLVLAPTIRLLQHVGLNDIPNERSSHAESVPRGAGVAVLAATGFGILVTAPSPTAQILVACALAIGAIGLIDDLLHVRPLPRLIATITVAAGAAYALDVPHVLAVALWLTACVNTTNFMDGINGITGLTAMVSGLFYGSLGHAVGNGTLTTVGAALAGASLGYLPFNAPSARVFLGDCGSYGIGATIGLCSVVAVSSGVPPLLALAPMAPYFADTTCTLLRRVRAGNSPFTPHREHTYQALATAWGHTRAALAYGGLAALSSIVALIAYAKPAAIPLIVAVYAAIFASTIIKRHPSTPAPLSTAIEAGR